MNVTAQRLIKRCLPLVCLLPLLLPMACKKDTAADPRDAYVGTWIEQSSDGVPTPAGATRDTLAITKTDNNKLRVDKLIVAGAFTASPVGTAYQADNTPINTGTVFNLFGYGRGTATLDNFRMATISGQLSATINYSVKAGTYVGTQQYVDVLVKQ